MLIGAHVSTAGGLETAVDRGVRLGCRSIQIVNQSPRVWKPSQYSPAAIEGFRGALAETAIESVAIHTSYLLNCATRDSSVRAKTLHSLIHALRLGDDLGAVGVVLHPGSQKGDEAGTAIKRAGEVMLEALDESSSCPILLEHSAGERRQLGRTFGQIASLIESADSSSRLGVCIDTCHLHAQGFDLTTEVGLDAALDQLNRAVGLDRLGLVHLNDSRDPLGSRKDRHANIGDGTMGPYGLAATLSSARLEGLPAILESPGPDRKGPDRREVDKANAIREVALSSRRGRKPRNGHRIWWPDRARAMTSR